tara:strand:- start:129282 stop:129479 length:198 start_codon:yes stop_codon:yes gene_type:complete
MRAILWPLSLTVFFGSMIVLIISLLYGASDNTIEAITPFVAVSEATAIFCGLSFLVYEDGPENNG